MGTSDAVRVTYRLDVEPDAAEARAEEIAREQTVEVPREVVRSRFIEEHVLGRVERVGTDADGRTLATLAYPVEATASDPAQLLNVVFGMTSLHADAAVVDLTLPDALHDALGGPRFGVQGLRDVTGVHGRALTCTALKPLGQTPEALAALLADFARAGLDVVKEDQGLADHAFCPFDARLEASLRVVEEVAHETGHRVVYAPNLIGSPETIFRQLDRAQEAGARAVMLSPMLVGLPVFWEVCQKRASVPVLAHPSLGGAQRFAPDVLFGTLYRAYGADAVIFVGYAGRFATPRATCRALVENLARPAGDTRPALPVPGGGVQLDTVAELIDFYGDDTMLLVGGSLQIVPGAVFERSRRFVEAVRAATAASPRSTA